MIRLKSMVGKNVGFKHTISISRKVEYVQSDTVEVLSATETLTDSDYEEMWDQFDVEDGAMDPHTFEERDHKERILKTEPFEGKCPYTVDMFTGKSAAGRTR